MSKTELLINVYARFLHKHTGDAIWGNHYKVKLFDKDLITDDFLGETYLHSEGKVHFRINPSLFRTNDNPLEEKPDLYLLVLKDDVEIFKSPVAPNIKFDKEGNFNFIDGEWIDMGTFLIDG